MNFNVPFTTSRPRHTLPSSLKQKLNTFGSPVKSKPSGATLALTPGRSGTFNMSSSRLNEQTISSAMKKKDLPAPQPFIKSVKFPVDQLSGGKNLLLGRLSNTPGQHNSGVKPKENRG